MLIWVLASSAGGGALYPGHFAVRSPDKPAVIMSDTGAQLSYAELDERSIRLARVLQAAGLSPGDDVAILSENSPHCYEVYWAALRSGFYITAVNTHLQPAEVAYVV
jgi:fatty-acyl-CoA synthase